MSRCALPPFCSFVLAAAIAGPVLGEPEVDEIRPPVVKDPRLRLELLANEPEVATPTALAADGHGRLYAAVTHTHSRTPQYPGPDEDRILVFEDSDRDGKLDRPRVYAAGLRNVLAIAFSRDGELYVVQMKSVVVLRDQDRDGACETATVLTVDTPNNNHHGVLLALALDDQNRLYVSLGNIGGSSYSIKGSDGSRISGQGDTGLIVRCRADGSQLERYAHGFWNPCDLRFDTAGRLLATDNDPDARGPNRVLHVIQGGQYGYKSRFGGSGLHPYCAWNGELPGTLPMLAGVGEAPVGLLECATAALPEDYAGDLLVCVWGTHEVVRIRAVRRGASLEGRVEPLIRGDASFRPTGIVATADGTVYIADWVDRRYPVHGKGRIWRLAVKPGIAKLRPATPFSAAQNDPGTSRLTELSSADTLDSFEPLMAAAIGPDPFAESAAMDSLARPVFRGRVMELLEDGDSRRRMAGLLALGRAGVALEAAALRQLIHDDDPRVRLLALTRIGETGRRDLAEDVKQSMTAQLVSADLFETFLATVQLLEAGAKVQRVTGADLPLRVNADQQFIRTVLADDRHAAAARAIAVRYLADAGSAESAQLLLRLAQTSDVTVATEAIRSLAEAKVAPAAGFLAAIARDASQPTSLRCEAIMSFAAADERDPEELLPLITSAQAPVALTAARALTLSARARQSVEQAFHSALSSVAPGQQPAAWLDQLRFALSLDADHRPRSDEQWRQAVQSGGDAEAGRRVFFDRRTGCSNCHSVHGRGGRIGPNLSNAAAAKSRDQILASILHPSKERSPDFQGYVVVMRDGQIHQGTQFHFRGESAELLLINGRLLRFALRDTEEYRALDESLMPERLVETMSVSELRDLMAFLAGLRGSL
jgi:putative membrane-bound dehydrogenase-like protein